MELSGHIEVTDLNSAPLNRPTAFRTTLSASSLLSIYTEKDHIANEAALHMDVRLGGYDRVCLIEVPDQRSMRTVFSEQRIEKTHSHLISECASFAARKNYRFYLLRHWQLAIAVPSYIVSLEEFTDDMRELQKLLFETKDDPYDLMHQYKIRHNLIYLMNEQYHFDGLLLTFPNLSRMQKDIYRDIPKVYLATELENEVTINYDDEPGIREAMDYLVKIKGVTRLCMLGGRDDNTDAQKRKRIFRQCLEENGLNYSETLYEPTDMSVRTQEAAGRVLDWNPDVQAVFCVNDASAAGLYDVLHEKGLEPGVDLYVFGFDNGPLASDLTPPLASVGSDGMTLGQKALEMLLDQMDGKEVNPQKIPTRLFGRESLMYDMYEFTAREMLSADNSFIDHFFDNCFYRYRNEIISQGSINLKRLFFEILSRMLKSVRNRFMSREEFDEISRMIEILFKNGIMLYTDPNRFVHDFSRLQGTMNETLKSNNVSVINNRLITLMKDCLRSGNS